MPDEFLRRSARSRKVRAKIDYSDIANDANNDEIASDVEVKEKKQRSRCGKKRGRPSVKKASIADVSFYVLTSLEVMELM